MSECVLVCRVWQWAVRSECASVRRADARETGGAELHDLFFALRWAFSFTLPKWLPVAVRTSAVVADVAPAPMPSNPA